MRVSGTSLPASSCYERGLLRRLLDPYLGGSLLLQRSITRRRCSAEVLQVGKFSPFSGPTAGLGIVGGTRTRVGQPVPDHIGAGPHGCAIAPEGHEPCAFRDSGEGNGTTARCLQCANGSSKCLPSCVRRALCGRASSGSHHHTRTVGAGWPPYLLFFHGKIYDAGKRLSLSAWP